MFKKLFITILFLSTSLFAEQEYSLRAAYGLATQNDLVEILVGDVNSHPKNLSVIAIDGGYLLEESAFELPVDIYLKGSISRFDESAAQRDALYETTLYIKAYWNFDFLENRARLGFGEGASYTSGILFVEYEEAIAEDGKNSHFLNYLDLSLDFDVGKLAGAKTLYGTYIGWALKHRSGIFGLINNVKRGGSNYNTLYIEKNF
jgi:outer membrane protein